MFREGRKFIKRVFFFFQAEDGIRDAQESRGLGGVYKGQAFSYLKAKTNKGKGGPKDRTSAGPKNSKDNKGKGARRNEGVFAWKDVAPKSGDPLTKTFKGKTYHWCTNHENSQWTLHNPNSFPNLCKGHPDYAAKEAAWKASGGDASSSGDSGVTAADIKLESALAGIDEESESDEEGDY